MEKLQTINKLYKINNILFNPNNINCIVDRQNGDYAVYMIGSDTQMILNKSEYKDLIKHFTIF